MKKHLLVAVSLFLFLSCSSKVGQEEFQITSWQEPVFLDDTTLILIRYDYVQVVENFMGGVYGKNGKQTLYHYIIPQKALIEKRVLNSHGPYGSSSERGVRLLYPWMLYSTLDNNGKEAVSLQNLETGEDEYMPHGDCPLFVTSNGRYIGLDYSGNDYRVWDRVDKEYILESTLDTPIIPIWFLERSDLIIGDLGNKIYPSVWSTVYSVSDSRYDTLFKYDSISSRIGVPRLLSSGNFCFTIDDSMYISSPEEYIGDRENITFIGDRSINVSDINASLTYYCEIDYSLNADNAIVLTELETLEKIVVTKGSRKVK